MNELVKPTLKVDLDIKLPEILPVEHNLNVIEDYTKDLIEFYGKLVFTPEQYTEAKEERTKVNKLLKFVSDNRKDIIKKYKKPIEDFESTSKRIEKGLQEAANIIGASLEKFDLEEQEKKRVIINEKIEKIREDFISDYKEYEKALSIFQIEFDKRWFNKTYKDSDLTNDIINQFNEKIDDLDKFKSDANLICEFYNNIDKNKVLNKEVYIERYKNIRDVNQIIEDIKNDYTKATELKEPEPKIDVDPFAGLSINNVPKKCYFKVICDESQKDLLINFAKNNNIVIEEEK